MDTGGFRGCVMVERYARDMDIRSRLNRFIYSPLSAMFTPEMEITEVKLRLNDITGLCMICIMICSRYAYTFDAFDEKEDPARKKSTSWLWNNVFKHNSPFCAEIPRQWNFYMWKEMVGRHLEWDAKDYDTKMKSVGLNSFVRTIQYCLKTLHDIGLQRFEDGVPNPLVHFEKGLIASYQKDCEKKVLKKQPPSQKKKKRRKLNTPPTSMSCKN